MTPTPADLKAWRNSYKPKLTQKEAAKRLRVSLRTYAAWELGEWDMPEPEAELFNRICKTRNAAKKKAIA
jgi:DNA-binding XRE family transcriptional regulator